jgi:hypothetical protein
MTDIEVEVISSEKESLIRSCKIKVNGRYVLTPSRTISVTKSSKMELDVTESLIQRNNPPFGEVYTRLSLDDLSKILVDDQSGKQFSQNLALRLEQLKSKGAIPYIVLALVDSNGNPYNQLPEDRILQLIFDFLWGTPNNSIIVPPLTGVFPGEEQYFRMIQALDERRKANIDRKALPIMPVIPSAYNLIAPSILEKYWEIGCRIFGFNCENKKYSAFGYIIERLHIELSKLSAQSKESYALHALNTRLKVGKEDSGRINNLLGSGFGFDVYSSNHIIPRYIQPPDDVKDHYVFDRENYGLVPLSNLKSVDILKTKAFEKYSLAQINLFPSSTLMNLCKAHNVESSVREIQKYPNFVENEELVGYLSQKEKIKPEIDLMRTIANHCHHPQTQKKLKSWLK